MTFATISSKEADWSGGILTSQQQIRWTQHVGQISFILGSSQAAHLARKVTLKVTSIAALITYEVRITRVLKLLILTSSFSSLQSRNLPSLTVTGTHLEVVKLQLSCSHFRAFFCLDLAIPNCPLQSKCPSQNVIKLHFSSLPPVSRPLEKIIFPISEPPSF